MKTGQIYHCPSDGELYVVIRRANVDYALVSLCDGQTIWVNAPTLDKLHLKSLADRLTPFTGQITVSNGKIT
jgi:hypothetical protein